MVFQKGSWEVVQSRLEHAISMLKATGNAALFQFRNSPGALARTSDDDSLWRAEPLYRPVRPLVNGRERNTRSYFELSKCRLFRAQRFHWIDQSSAPCRKQAREQRGHA